MAGILLTLLPAAACQAPAGTRPRARNVVFVLTDDQGWGDLGLLGTPGIRTPNLDRLAREGARLTDFHAAQPVCSASRADFLTGCYPQRLGLHGALGPRSTAIDVLPTVAAALGAPLPELPIDGHDLLPLLSGATEEAPHEALFFSYGVNELEAVRAGRWKLHFPHAYRTLRGEPGRGGIPGKYDYSARIGLTLFDLASDPGERTDVAARHPEVVLRLSELADAHRRELGDTRTGVVGSANRAPGRR